MYIVLLFFLVGNLFTTTFAMDDSVESPFHDIVDEVSRGYDVEIAKETIRKLYEMDRNPNNIARKRTAAGLSVDYCVHRPNFFENQLSILALLLSFDEKKGLDSNKKDILTFLDLKSDDLNLCLGGLRKRPFSGTSVDGGGFFIDDDADDEDDQKISSTLNRISQVKEEVKNLNN